MNPFTSMPAIRKWNRASLTVAAITGIGWAIIPSAGLARMSGVVSVFAGLACGLLAERAESLRQQDLEPRKFTSSQMARLLGFTGMTPKGPLNLAVPVADQEAVAYGDFLGKTLQLAGWLVDQRAIIGVSAGANRCGLTIRTSDVDSQTARLLRDAFREASIPVATVLDANCPTAEIFVGAKPPRK